MEHAIYRMNKPRLVHEPRSTMELVMEHRLALFGTVVSAAVLGTGWKIMQNKSTNSAQKFMNIRLYGQMAGLAAIIVMMGLTAARRTVPDDRNKGK